MGFIREPHQLTLTRPTESQDSVTNIGSRSEDGVKARTIRGFFQERPGDEVQTREGSVVTLDAILYTTNQDVINHDVLQPLNLPTTEIFVVTDTEKKYAINGRFTHQQCTLTLESKIVRSS